MINTKEPLGKKSGFVVIQPETLQNLDLVYEKMSTDF